MRRGVGWNWGLAGGGGKLGWTDVYANFGSFLAAFFKWAGSGFSFGVAGQSGRGGGGRADAGARQRDGRAED